MLTPTLTSVSLSVSSKEPRRMVKEDGFVLVLVLVLVDVVVVIAHGSEGVNAVIPFCVVMKDIARRATILTAD